MRSTSRVLPRGEGISPMEFTLVRADFTKGEAQQERVLEPLARAARLPRLFDKPRLVSAGNLVRPY